jgi:hypothetical protein
MKTRFTLLSGLAALALLFTASCTREYTCQCKFTYSGAPGLPEGVVKEYKLTDTKGGAKSKCEAASKTYSEAGIITTENCAIF